MNQYNDYAEHTHGMPTYTTTNSGRWDTAQINYEKLSEMFPSHATPEHSQVVPIPYGISGADMIRAKENYMEYLSFQKMPNGDEVMYIDKKALAKPDRYDILLKRIPQ